MTRLIVDPAAPDRRALDDAARVIAAGGVVAFPTDTLYGLAADPFNTAAVARLFALKGRAENQPLPLIAGDLAQVVDLVGAIPPVGRALAARFWPGPLTLVVRAPSRVPEGVTARTGRVGMRVPDHAVARGLCEACGHAVTATSANRSGHDGAVNADEVARTLAAVDLLLDGGPAPGGVPSTVVDVSDGIVRLIRPGALSWEDVLACAADA